MEIKYSYNKQTALYGVETSGLDFSKSFDLEAKSESFDIITCLIKGVYCEGVDLVNDLFNPLNEEDEKKLLRILKGE